MESTGLDLSMYGDGLVDVGVSRIPTIKSVSNRPRYHGSPETHHQLLEHGRAVIQKLVEDRRIKDAASPILFHPDLNKRNIFVSDENPAQITAFIDWQSASIEPAFWHADEVPDYAQPVPDPSQRYEYEPKSEACAKAFNICTQFNVPKLAAPRLMDENFFRLFRYCYRTWEDGAVVFREELIEISRRWKALGLAGSCPFSVPGDNEVAAHKKDFRLFEASQQLKHALSNLLNTATDGWVPAAEWEAAKLAHKQAYAQMLEVILNNKQPDDDEPLRSEADLREVWPFDLDKVADR